MEAISLDFNDQLLRVLGSQRLMHMDYERFDVAMGLTAEVFTTWEENMKDFTNVAREGTLVVSTPALGAENLAVSRKRAEKFISIKISPAHTKLQERIDYIRAFRRSHEQLRVMTSSTKTFSGLGKDAPFGIDMAEEVRASYEHVKNVDVLDVTPGMSLPFISIGPLISYAEGSEIWYIAESAYNDRIARIENSIISRLRDKLATARNAQEMFRVFSKFNTLFVRPKVGDLQVGSSKLTVSRFVEPSRSIKLVSLTL